MGPLLLGLIRCKVIIVSIVLVAVDMLLVSIVLLTLLGDVHQEAAKGLVLDEVMHVELVFQRFLSLSLLHRCLVEAVEVRVDVVELELELLGLTTHRIELRLHEILVNLVLLSYVCLPVSFFCWTERNRVRVLQDRVLLGLVALLVLLFSLL